MHSNSPQELTIGVLYPGELGSALGDLLSRDGFDVVTTTEGRSARTRTLCSQTSVHVLATFEDVLDVSDVVISLVSPASAVDVAQRFVDCIPGFKNQPRFFIDANSVSPQTARDIHRRIDLTGVRFCDASIRGMAKRLRTEGKMYVSGEAAKDVEEIFGNTFSVHRLGNVVGDASAMKMLMGGLNKGLAALFVELSLLADRMELTDAFMEDGRAVYPGLFDVIERVLPTYPQHSARRAEEMLELGATVRSLGLNPRVADASHHTFAQLSRSSLKQRWQTLDGEHLNLRSLMDLIGQEFPFAALDDDTQHNTQHFATLKEE